jgi:hypothetical protein
MITVVHIGIAGDTTGAGTPSIAAPAPYTQALWIKKLKKAPALLPPAAADWTTVRPLMKAQERKK